jgi:probable sporulation protein (polysaccharide deacetylase family)
MARRPIKMMAFIIYLILFTFILTIANSTSIETYITTLKQKSVLVDQPGEDPLAKEIKQLAEQVEQPPVDAKIDRVWKAIPGYNGLKVDVQKSYQLSQKMGRVNLDTLVIDEIEPDVRLTDLPPSPIYRGNSKKPMVSFMVNVAWGTEYVKEMLDIFEQQGVKVTFFLDGKWLKKNPSIAKKMLSQGHEIGNHAYSHPDLRKMSEDRIRQEMTMTNELIEQLGVKCKLFAPPSGAFDNRVVIIAHQLKMKTVLWTLDTVDWKNPPAGAIVDRVVPKLENGVLILMHPTPSTVEALPSLIDGVHQKKLMLGTVSQLISPQRTISVVRLD